MKTLKESIFDGDFASKDTKVGDLYEFASIPHYNIYGGTLIS